METMHHATFLQDLAIVMIVAGIVTVLFRQLKQPVVLGYILAGVAVGPNTGGPTVGAVHDIELLAEIGVALLLFTIGLHFSLDELAPVRRVALLGTAAQMALTIAFGYGLGRLLGFGWQEAAWFGALLSLSSTAVVLKSLSEQGVMGTFPAGSSSGCSSRRTWLWCPSLSCCRSSGTSARGSPSSASRRCGLPSSSR